MLAPGRTLGPATRHCRGAQPPAVPPCSALRPKAAVSTRAPLLARAQETNGFEYGSSAAAEAGRRLQDWLGSPFDLISFGPRAGTGALLSLPERLQSLQYDIDRARELAQDPRPLEDKQAELLKELEDTVVEFLEKGATIEQDVLANLKTVLPAQAADLLTELIPEPPLRRSQGAGAATQAEPMDFPSQPVTRYGQDDVYAEQVASEMSEIRNAVSSLKASLDSMRTNTEPADAKILMINLKEARDQLERRLAEIRPATAADPSIASAEREARILLGEVDTTFMFS